MGRFRSGDHARYQSQRYDVYGELLIEGVPLTPILGRNPLKAATWSAAADQLVGTGQITLARTVNGTSLSPLESAPALGDIHPLPGRLFELRTAIVDPGETPSPDDYITVFDGEIDAADVAGESLVLDCRDGMAFYADRIIEPPIASDVYGYPVTGGTMESVLQTLSEVWDSFTDPLGPNARGVLVLGDPEWTVIDFYQQAGVSMAEAMHAVVLQRGWAIHWRHWEYQGRGNPTAYDPLRSDLPGADTYPLFGLQEILRYHRLRLDRSRVRNVIEMMYGADRTRLKTEDEDSIRDYGRRYMLFSEDATSQIDTAEEAGRMLEAALADQKDAGVELDYERLYFSAVQLGDTHIIPPNPGKHPELLQGVVGFTHSLDWNSPGRFRTTIRTVNRSLAAKVRWRKVEPRMVHVSLTDPVGMAPERAIWIPVSSLS